MLHSLRVPRRHRAIGFLCVRIALAGAFLALLPSDARSDDKWIEAHSAHFTVVSNASEGAARSVAWQLEQIRSVLAALWPWARVDLNRPLVIVAAKDESSLRALAPEYWERKNDVRPVSLWVTGADGPYMALRTDLPADDRATLNPHLDSYYSYVSLVLQSSAPKPLPLWLSRGLAGVMSNTIVRDTFIRIGPPIPYHIQRLRDRSRMTLDELATTTRASGVFADADRMRGFDAQSWALVHYLMFG